MFYLNNGVQLEVDLNQNGEFILQSLKGLEEIFHASLDTVLYWRHRQ